MLQCQLSLQWTTCGPKADTDRSWCSLESCYTCLENAVTADNFCWNVKYKWVRALFEAQLCVGRAVWANKKLGLGVSTVYLYMCIVKCVSIVQNMKRSLQKKGKKGQVWLFSLEFSVEIFLFLDNRNAIHNDSLYFKFKKHVSTISLTCPF